MDFRGAPAFIVQLVPDLVRPLSADADAAPPFVKRDRKRVAAVARAVAFQVVLFAGIVGAAFVAMRLISLPPTNVTVVWLPAGIALWALMTRHWAASLPTILMANWAVIAIANNYPFLTPRPLSLIMAGANTVAPAIGAWIWRRYLPADPFNDGRSFLRWFAGVAALPALLTAWIIPAVITFAGFLSDPTTLEFWTRVGSITLSSTLGVFLVLPVLKAPWDGGMIKRTVPLGVAQLTNAAVALLIALIGFNLSPVGLYLAIPFTFLSAFACGARGLGIGLFIFINYGLWATSEGLGPFAGHDAPLTSLFEMAAAALCLGVPGHFAGIILGRLSRHGDELQQAVADRTRELQASEERFRLATDAASEAVFEWREGLATAHLNRAIERKLGHFMGEAPMTWAGIWRHLHPGDRAALRPQIKSLMDGAAEVFCLDARLRTRSGEWCWFQSRGRVLTRDKRSRPDRIVGTFMDVNAEKMRMAELASAKDRADSRERAKDTFLANISHEIRTPMNAMLGFARMLDGTKLDASQSECVEAILTSGDLLLDLLNDLLDLSRIDAGAFTLEPQPGDLVKTIRQVTKLFESQAKQKNVPLRLELAPNLPTYVEFDRLRIHQVVANLLSNAVKFTTVGSVKLSVRADLSNSSPSATNSGAPRHWRISFDVLDTGIGIAPGQINQLFTPFTQADSSIARRFGGTGLGLAISRRLCELMGGTIRATSRPGHGSLFSATVVLPECATPPPEAGEESDSVPPLIVKSAKPLHILVVEDNPLNRRLTDLLLQRLGHTAVMAEDGPSGLKLAAKQRFDLVLMDLQLPGDNGMAVTRRLRESSAETNATRPDVPVIALTATTGDEETARCREAGMNDFLTKPLDPRAFQRTLERFGSTAIPSTGE